MVVVAVIGILAAIAIPNYIAQKDRAREASLKANMHTAQLCVEDFAVLAEGYYPGTVDTRVGDVLSNLGFPVPGGWQSINPFALSLADGRRVPPFSIHALLHPHQGFANPFIRLDNAVDNMLGPPAVPPPGCLYFTGYDETGPKTTDGDVAIGYSICGYGKNGPLTLILSSGH
jgi:hypothetical protein